MAKNSGAFFASNKSEVTDPVADAHRTLLEAAEAPAAPVTPPGLAAETVITTATDAKVDSDAQSSVEDAIVQDTTSAVSKEIGESSIIRTNRQDKIRGNVIQRPTGGNSRETSPSNTGNQKDHVVSNSFAAQISSERVTGTTTAVATIAFLDKYVKVMAPRKITSTAEILAMQEGLLNQLTFILSQAPAKEFSRLWTIVIKYFAEYKDGAFSPMYVNRGAKEWKRDPAHYTQLTSLINLLQASAADMKSVKEIVSIETVFKAGYTEDTRGRVTNYYSKM